MFSAVNYRILFGTTVIVITTKIHIIQQRFILYNKNIIIIVQIINVDCASENSISFTVCLILINGYRAVLFSDKIRWQRKPLFVGIALVFFEGTWNVVIKKSPRTTTNIGRLCRCFRRSYACIESQSLDSVLNVAFLKQLFSGDLRFPKHLRFHADKIQLKQLSFKSEKRLRSLTPKEKQKTSFKFSLLNSMKIVKSTKNYKNVQICIVPW